MVEQYSPTDADQQLPPGLWQGPPAPNLLQGVAPMESTYGLSPPIPSNKFTDALGEDLWGFARGAAGAGRDLLTTPGDVYAGKYDVRDLPEVARDYAGNWASTVTPLSRGTPGKLGIFGGESAANADLGTLSKALKMETGHISPAEKNEFTWLQSRIDRKAGLSQGEWDRYHELRDNAEPAPPIEIHAKTGWYRDVDDNWKFEIPDTGAKWKDAAKEEGIDGPRVRFSYAKDYKLGDVLDHPALYEAYPDIKDMRVGPSHMMAGWDGINGSYSKEHGFRITNARGDAPMMSTLLHEIQHHIQEQEGFATGGNTAEFLPKGFDEVQKASRDRVRAVPKQFTDNHINQFTVANARQTLAEGRKLFPFQQDAMDQLAAKPGLLEEWDAAHSEAEKLDATAKDAFKKYQTLAGETEARNVQERWENGPYHGHPLRTTGYPQGEQIVRYHLPGESSSIDAFHGSPHEFEGEAGHPLGRFRDERIGTGEGNQTYGHGHYAAEIPDTAETYQKAGARSSPSEGNLYDVKIKPDKHELLDLDKKLSEQTPEIQAKLAKLPEHFQQALADHADNYGMNSPLDSPDASTGHQFIRAAQHYNVTDHPEEISKMLHEVGIPGSKYLDQQSRGRAVLTAKDIQQYEAAIAEHHKQIASAQDELDRNKNNPNLLPAFFERRQDVIDWSKGRIAAHQQKIADMREGKHLTHNFVIFHPDNIKITGKNGETISPVEHNPFPTDLTPVDHDPFAPPVHPKYPGARLAPNGRWYTPDPDRPGKWLEPPQ